MPKIGIVLAGGGSRGPYELGCLKAIEDFFGRESIKCISASSIGVLNAYAFGVNQTDTLMQEWKNIDVTNAGRFIFSYPSIPDMVAKIRAIIPDKVMLPFEMFGTVWNFTDRKVEYIPFHELNAPLMRDYMCAALAVPIFNKGVRLNGRTLLDGAALDNIPVYPLVNRDLDYIFVIYFDGHSYMFENEDFDKKVIKLYNFPNQGTWDSMVFDPNRVDNMYEFGAKYTREVLEELFVSNDTEAVYQSIREHEAKNRKTVEKRLTGDVVLSSINTMTRRYAKRMSKRKKL